MTQAGNGRLTHIEWPTLIVCLLCYLGFGISTFFATSLGVLASGILLTLALTLYSSFNHEVLHGHPFENEHANTALVFPALGILIPYYRFRDTHLEHHHDPVLTDPYDDPETNYIAPDVWAGWGPLRQSLYRFNNTLLGRMTVGPVIGLISFYHADMVAIVRGNRKIVTGYLFHLAGLVPVALWLGYAATMPLWVFAIAVYASHSILKIRTFLEHRAHEKARCRSVVIEDQGLLSYLFLKNNLHAVHHACPTVPWYQLEDHYAQRRSTVLTRNGGYFYASYQDIFRQYFLHAKDPVPHQTTSDISSTPAPGVDVTQRYSP
ncbi:MAG: fatty acid desaturase [Roseobacter sp.]